LLKLQKSRQSHDKHDAGCQQQCPLVAASSSIAISKLQPLATAMLGIAELQPRFVTYTFLYRLPVRHSAALDPPTLLCLACALTT